MKKDKDKGWSREDMIKSLEEISSKLDADSNLLKNMKERKPSKKFFAPSVNTYKWISVISSFGMWVTTCLLVSGMETKYQVLYMGVMLLLLGILTCATHLRGVAMGMLLATKSKSLREYINGNN